MDKKSPKGRKRANKEVEDHFWDCSVCTYKNNPEAFKCLMCDVRKGTSTRKPRLNPDLVAIQVQQALTPPPPIIPRALREDYRSSNSSRYRSLNDTIVHNQTHSRDNNVCRNVQVSLQRYDDRSARDDGNLTRPGSSASNSSNETPVNNTDVASPANSDVPPTPSTPEPEPGPSNQSTPPSSSAKSSRKPKDPNATPKERKTKTPGTRAKLRNIDKKNATHHSVTVDAVTFVITEYKLKPKKEKKPKVEAATTSAGGSAHEPMDTNNEDSTSVNGGGPSSLENPPSEVPSPV